MLYENIKKLCEKSGINIMTLEKKAGLGNGTIGGWRTSDPCLSNVLKVADVLGVSIADLVSKR